MGLDTGRDAGVAGQRPAPRSAPEPRLDLLPLGRKHRELGGTVVIFWAGMR